MTIVEFLLARIAEDKVPRGRYVESCLALATVYADHPDYDEAWRP